MTPTLYYCYDAYCGWCFGFSGVIKKLAVDYKDRLVFDVLSGGMLFSEQPQHVGAIAAVVRDGYQTVERLTGVEFGEPFLWHMQNPAESDWYPESTKSAIALCIFKEYHPDAAIFMAADLQYALNVEGRDLTDNEAYRHLLDKYGIPEDEFYQKLHSEEYREKAYYEFALVKQLQVKGFPCVLLQVTDSKFYLLTNGYTDYETLQRRLEGALSEIAA